MTVSSQLRINTYVGNSVATVFPFNFPIYEDDHLEVRLYDRATNLYDLLSPSDYSAVGIGPNSTGGAVTYNPGGVPIPSTKLIAVMRTVPYTQDTSIRNQDGFYPDVIERALDELTMQTQQLAEQVSRSLVLPPTSTIDTDEFISQVLALNAISSEMVILSGISGQIVAVAAIDDEVVIVANNVAAVSTVSGIAVQVVAVAGIATAVQTVATNVVDITNFSDVYLGPKTADPTTRNDGSALVAGDLYYKTTATKGMRVYDTVSGWGVALGIPTDGSMTNAKLADMAAGTIKGRALGAGTGVPQDLTDAQVATILGAYLRLSADCELIKSGSNIVLQRKNGSLLAINGVNQVIPSGGVSLAPTGLTPSTFYYIYAYMNGGTMTLEASATAPALSSTTGFWFKTGDATRTLVGAVYVVTGPAFQDSLTGRFVLTWFNRSQKTARLYTATTSKSGSTLAEISSSYRNQFIAWGDNEAKASLQSNITCDTALQDVITNIGLDGTTSAASVLPGNRINRVTATQSSDMRGINLAATFTPTVGLHYITPLGAVSGGIGAWTDLFTEITVVG